MSREDHRLARRHLVDRVDKHHPLALETLHNVEVVHDLVVDVQRRAHDPDRFLHGLDRHVDPGTKAARVGQNDFHPAKGIAVEP